MLGGEKDGTEGSSKIDTVLMGDYYYSYRRYRLTKDPLNLSLFVLSGVGSKTSKSIRYHRTRSFIRYFPELVENQLGIDIRIY